MYKILRADKDAYISNRVIADERMTSSNVGAAGSLNLYKLYGMTTTSSIPNGELTRGLIHFDLESLQELYAAGKIDITNPSFECKIKLHDVYGGQPTPVNFTLVVNPLSRSFDEGLGRDVVYHSDDDVCNWLTASVDTPWHMTGCSLSGALPNAVDYVTSASFGSTVIDLQSTQLFTSGEEDLEVDVTAAVSATLAGLLPDAGFRIAYEPTLEDDSRTYFVKRFASRTAFNVDVRPKLIVKFDDSVQDDGQILNFDSTSTLFLYNYSRSRLAPITSGSALTPITGSNSLILKLSTEISGGTYELVFTGSQHRSGINWVSGTYSASVYIPSSDVTLAAKLAVSGTVRFTPIWGSLDGTVAFVTGTVLNVYPAERTATSADGRNFTVNVLGVMPSYTTNESVSLRVHIFDQTSPLIVAKRRPVEMPGIVVRDAHYQVRDPDSGVIHIPFDTVKNSTRLSSDAKGMFFKLDTANLSKDRSYVIDVKITTADGELNFRPASPVFKVTDLR